MHYTLAFNKFLKTVLDRGHSQNQVLGELNLYAAELKHCYKKEEEIIPALFQQSYHTEDIKSSTFFALEYNNAFLFAFLNPNNILIHLKKAISEKRYYFVFTAVDLLLSSKIKDKTKEELSTFIEQVRFNIGLPPKDFDNETYNELIFLTDKILEIAINNWYIFDKISINYIEPFISIHKSTVMEDALVFERTDIIKLREDITEFYQSLNP